jgi:hypothetical protein
VPTSEARFLSHKGEGTDCGKLRSFLKHHAPQLSLNSY